MSARAWMSPPRWISSGDLWVWSSATAIGLGILAVVGLLGLIGVRGLEQFWPSNIAEIRLAPEAGSGVLLGELVRSETVSRQRYVESSGQPPPPTAQAATLLRYLIKTGNRRIDPPDFRWIYAHDIEALSYPPDAVALERREWGTAYGFVRGLTDAGGNNISTGPDLFPTLAAELEKTRALDAQIRALETGTINRINRQLEQLRLERRAAGGADADPGTLAELNATEADLLEAYAAAESRLRELISEHGRERLELSLANGTEASEPLADVLRAWRPNRMSIADKLGHYLESVWLFLSEPPREANTEGGIFPAIFGTVLMVILMSLVVTPLGVIAALYLHEYAHQGNVVRVIRIAVNNLAGVPSIVFGVFGLGFFVYFVGGGIDQLFFRNALPAPTFGTPGLLWAALTLALLTLPVVVVTTEEGLSRIPQSLREGSLALGATRAETLFRIIVPLSAPAILTGVILAVARAAGEVAPLMLVGVVKLAPSLPIDGTFPFLHLERKFMHLGFHIYDVGFQSPNVEAARPLVYSTALLLTVVIVSLNIAAMLLRARLERASRGLLS